MSANFPEILKVRKRWIIILIELLVIMIFVPGWFKGKELIKEFSSTDFSNVVSGEESFYTGSSMVVPRAFLEVEVETKPIDADYWIETKRLDTGTYYGMKCNEIKVFSGDSSVTYEVYVTDKEACISFDIRGAEFTECPIESIRVYNTHRANGVLIVLLLLFFCFVDILIFKRRAIIEKGDSKKELTFAVLFGCTVISLIPELNDYISFGSKGMDAIVKIETMLRVLRDKGPLISSHYKDLYLIIPVILRWIGFPIIIAYKANIVIVATVTTLVTYKFVRICRGSTRIAVAITAAYVLCPYRLYVLYNLCDMRQYTMMAFPPLIIISVICLNKETIKSFLRIGLLFPILWGLSCITGFFLRKKKYVIEVAVVIIILVSMYYLGETARERPAIWLYNIENFYRLQ